MRAFSRRLPSLSNLASISAVPPASATAPLPQPAVASTVESACHVPVEILGIAGKRGPVPGVDFVPTSAPPALPSKGAGRYFQAEHQRNRIKGWALRERVIQMHCFEGKNLRETARLLGRSYKRTTLVWAAVCREVSGGKATPEAHREAVRGYLDSHFRRVMEGAQALLGEAAAYGAVVVQAGKALADLHGIRPEDTLPAGFNLEDVGREVRVVSPLLIDRLDKVRALSGLGADPSVGHAVRWAKGREVSIEGAPLCPVAAPVPAPAPE